ncbi:dTMP kinase [Gorillibacterium massiliense]|uniref:dTMP kinase n=1 Tax=Gorillibacterium massiliense TaxID=1280390 RepID=UPI0004ADBCBF|nr:thymidylate kinase [Gorillibacterium massiliense]
MAKEIFMKGKIMVLEGIDGSGKSTQAKMAADYFADKGVPALYYKFPRYQETFFGKEVANYLNGKFGGVDETHPKLSSLLYAGDRFEKKGFLLKELSKGTVIVLDRYVTSNIAHQGAKLPEEEFADFKVWVEELEYGVYGLPKPALTVFLDMPPGVTDSLVDKRVPREYTHMQKDIHEADKSYLHRVYDAYRVMAAGAGWDTLVCHEENRPRTVEAIHRDIIARLEKE